MIVVCVYVCTYVCAYMCCVHVCVYVLCVFMCCVCAVQAVGIPLLKEELASVSISDISGKANIKIGKIKYNVKK